MFNQLSTLYEALNSDRMQEIIRPVKQAIVFLQSRSDEVSASNFEFNVKSREFKKLYIEKIYSQITPFAERMLEVSKEQDV